ncbi:MAG: prepilin-type N-terminal cleavage/methylation domain-containing protein [Desulfobacteraceae bacterium]|jgi:prepilin-type N-terminal cleavage/methylation domain-containing protein
MQQSQTIKDNINGFTLIEAMISIFIVSIGLLAITRMQVTEIKGNSSAMATMRATLDSGAIADQLLSTNYDDLPEGPSEPIPSLTGEGTTTYTVTDIPLYSGQTCKSIAITTNFTDTCGNPVTIQSTMIKLE